MLGREKPVHIYAHQGLEKVVDVQLQVSNARLNFEIKYHLLNDVSGEVLVENKHFRVETIRLEHGIPCSGFLIREVKKPRNITKSAIEKYHIPIDVRNQIKMGEDLKMADGTVIKNEELTSDPPKIRSYAYCSDTAYSEDIVETINGVDLLYHEATFMEDKRERAKETYHSTAAQAAEIAKKAGVGKLLLGHFSARYKEMDLFLSEASAIFEHVTLAEDGTEYSIA
ncbi:MAG: ribonuclease Z [Proteobacteria bacterium]|nr:ribonuclease Z [Pseudomonadota bacterium]